MYGKFDASMASLMRVPNKYMYSMFRIQERQGSFPIANICTLLEVRVSPTPSYAHNTKLSPPQRFHILRRTEHLNNSKSYLR